jgi:hypothetical protein
MNHDKFSRSGARSASFAKDCMMMAVYFLKGKLSGTSFEALPVHAQLATETFALGNLRPSLKQLAIGSTSEPWMAMMGFITPFGGLIRVWDACINSINSINIRINSMRKAGI